MYVSALDRPWLETPFLFQGFLIESAEVIDELREYCSYVYVDIAKGDASIAIPHSTSRRPREAANGAAAAGRAKAASGPPVPEAPIHHSDEDTNLLRSELVHAREAHEAAERSIRDLMTRLGAGEEIDLPAVQGTLNPMIDSIIRNDDAMSWLARMKRKDDYIYDHSIASSIWAMIFGKHLGLGADDLRVLGMGAMFFDVGKTRIPRELLVKPDRLVPEEATAMRRHVEYGVEIVRRIEGVDLRVIDMVAGHHERYNGTGYPRGLAGADIPVFARIAGIVDAYDAMTTPRPYAKPLSTFDAIRQLNKFAGVEFPEEVVEQFIQAIGVFPVGSLVELNTGEVGVVIAQNRVRRLRPKIMLILDAAKAKLPQTRIVDLRNQLADATGENSLWIEQGLAPGAYDIDPSDYYL